MVAENRMREFFSCHEGEMFALLKELVTIQSGSLNKEGVNQVGRAVRQALADLPLLCRRIRQDELGDHLLFSTPAAKHSEAGERKNILITGHMDTVFPQDTDFNWYLEDENKAYGPGVIDMKGGLVVTIFAIRALAAQGVLAELPIMALFNSDEEIGSPTSSPLLQELATDVCCGLVTECGGLQGEVVTGRRGKRGYHLEVHGRAGHAAFAGKNKASAIVEMARKILAMEALNDPETGLVVNVGTVQGGIGPNTVAENAAAEIDTRYCSEAAGQELRQQFDKITAKNNVDGVSASLQVTHDRPLMEAGKANKKLFGLFAEQAEEFCIPLCEEFRAGVSDANTLAGEGVPVLDGLGPIGEYDHSDREYMLKSSLLERSLLLAATLPKIADAFSKAGLARNPNPVGAASAAMGDAFGE
ncbi:MAG TPA: M20 family peptidase [Desulfobulbus sp.]|nr:M20 family peptidase [Desulfobulbus sp.]